jgi:hypothetical protein
MHMSSNFVLILFWSNIPKFVCINNTFKFENLLTSIIKLKRPKKIGENVVVELV